MRLLAAISLLLCASVWAQLPASNNEGARATRPPVAVEDDQNPDSKDTDGTSDSVAQVQAVGTAPSRLPASAGKGTKKKKKHDSVHEMVYYGNNHWSYHDYGTASQFWAALRPDYRLCAFGKAQSPINIQSDNSVFDPASYQLSPLLFNYKRSDPSKFKEKDEKKQEIDMIKNNGQTITYLYQPGSYFQMNPQGERYELLNLHFHSPSEHQINGKRFDAEAHLVHRSKEGRLAIVVLLFDKGENNPWLDSLHWDALPTREEGYVVNVPINAAGAFSWNRNYYYYHGSLSTPPCTEGVNYFIMQEHATISARQLDKLRASYNYVPTIRPIQPMYNRKVFSSKGIPPLFSFKQVEANADVDQESLLQRAKAQEQKGVIFTTHSCGCDVCPCHNTCGCSVCPCQTLKPTCGEHTVVPCFYHTQAAFSHQHFHVVGSGGSAAFSAAQSTTAAAQSHVQALERKSKSLAQQLEQTKEQESNVAAQLDNAKKVLAAAQSAETTAKTQLQLEQTQEEAARKKAEEARAAEEAARKAAEDAARKKAADAAAAARAAALNSTGTAKKVNPVMVDGCGCNACPCVDTHVAVDVTEACGCAACPCQKVVKVSCGCALVENVCPCQDTHITPEMREPAPEPSPCGCPMVENKCPCQDTHVTPEMREPAPQAQVSCGCPMVENVCPCQDTHMTPEMREPAPVQAGCGCPVCPCAPPSGSTVHPDGSSTHVHTVTNVQTNVLSPQ